MYKKRLLFFLSGIYLVLPTSSGGMIWESYDGFASKSSCEIGRGSRACDLNHTPRVSKKSIFKKIAVDKEQKLTPNKREVETVYSILKASRRVKSPKMVEVYEKPIFLDGIGNVMQFDNSPPKEWIPYKENGLLEFKRYLLSRKRLTINKSKADPLLLRKESFSGKLKGGSRYSRGAKLRVNREIRKQDENIISVQEYAALVPIVSRQKTVSYFDLKSKFYDAKEKEINVGLVLHRQVSPSIVWGVNAFTDVRFLPEGRYQWYSLGWEMFFKSLVLGGNYYCSNGEGNPAFPKDLQLDPVDLGNSTITIQERLPGDGYDLAIRFAPNKYIRLYGRFFSFHNPHRVLDALFGYKVGAEFDFYLNKRYSFSLKSEFSRDSEKDVFSLNLGFNLPVGRSYGEIMRHVEREKNIVLFDSENSYPVKSVFLLGETKHQIKEIVEFSDGKEIVKPSTTKESLRKLYHLMDDGKDGEVTLPKEVESVIIADGAILEVHLPYLGSERTIDYVLPKSKKTIKFSSERGGTVQKTLITGAAVDLADPMKYTLKDVVFDWSEIRSSTLERPFIDDENVSIVNSFMEFSNPGLKSVFHSTKSDTSKDGKVKVNYRIKNLRISLPNVQIDPKNPAKDVFESIVSTASSAPGTKGRQARASLSVAGEVHVSTKMDGNRYIKIVPKYLQEKVDEEEGVEFGRSGVWSVVHADVEKKVNVEQGRGAPEYPPKEVDGKKINVEQGRGAPEYPPKEVDGKKINVEQGRGAPNAVEKEKSVAEIA